VERGDLVVVRVGDDDRLTPRGLSDEIVARVPGAEYVIIPDSGHMVTLEKPDAVNASLLDLLARVRRDIGDDGADAAV
jgi:pimeloyl-ACP methyl ester carboxylesterase